MSGFDQPAVRAAAFLAQQVPPALAAEGARLDACVMATEVACRAGKALGVPVRPQAVRLMVFNPAVAAWAAARGRLPNSRAEALAIPGNWSLGVGWPAEAQPGRWPGHLVALVGGQGGPVLVDLTLPQANRPQHGITLLPLIYPLALGEAVPFLTRGAPLQVDHHGCLLVYYADHRVDYLTSPDWARPRRLLLPDDAWRAAYAAYTPDTPA